jgi:hypothetical protein
LGEQKYLNAEDTITGRLGRVYATIDGALEEMMYLTKLEAKQENKTTEIPVLGLLATQHKSTGVSYTGSATIRYVTSKYRELMNKYAKTGVDTYFDIYGNLYLLSVLRNPDTGSERNVAVFRRKTVMERTFCPCGLSKNTVFRGCPMWKTTTPPRRRRRRASS